MNRLKRNHVNTPVRSSPDNGVWQGFLKNPCHILITAVTAVRSTIGLAFLHHLADLAFGPKADGNGISFKRCV
jgi:hypothetical protein